MCVSNVLQSQTALEISKRISVFQDMYLEIICTYALDSISKYHLDFGFGGFVFVKTTLHDTPGERENQRDAVGDVSTSTSRKFVRRHLPSVTWAVCLAMYQNGWIPVLKSNFQTALKKGLWLFMIWWSHKISFPSPPFWRKSTERNIQSNSLDRNNLIPLPFRQKQEQRIFKSDSPFTYLRFRAPFAHRKQAQTLCGNGVDRWTSSDFLGWA